eukprot:snap_masked-scaffold_13-processed-gene-8.49-mRNA-1 protein AED:1.00 eAED:1.00 QI:0/-1/0/0/-1/1/1/0/191
MVSDKKHHRNPKGKAERKRKRKELVKETAKKQKENNSICTKADNCLDYLKSWESKKHGGSWKFNKALQVWILRNMYKKSIFSSSDFQELIIPYLTSIQGASKSQTLEFAREVVSVSVEEKLNKYKEKLLSKNEYGKEDGDDNISEKEQVDDEKTEQEKLKSEIGEEIKNYKKLFKTERKRAKKIVKALGQK